MPRLTITFEICAEQVDQHGEISSSEIANTVRRTAHAIEASEEIQVGGGGNVVSFFGKIIGTWEVQE